MSPDETSVCISGRCKNGQDVIIHVDCASHVYPDGTVGIHDMCFSVCRGEIVALYGANGSGKSTLMEHLNGLMTPSAGSVYVMGKPCSEIKKTVWRHVGLVFQRPDDQLFAPTVLDDVMFGPVNLGMGKEEARAAAQEALELVGAAGLAGKTPNYLSGGEKRLVAIAGVLVMKPAVICMDEPTADLDGFHRLRIEELILRLRNAHGVSLVIATHDADMAARIADRVCIVHRGSIIAEGPPGDIFYDRDALLRAGLSPPEVVDIYLKYCDRKGVVPAERPVTTSQLLNAIAR
ncbi:MAG: Trehalose/maltose import ATP-binding protein MalK [Methanocella sp. PtaU1.Bin125]|nr:MAG: Trehalose/maltose import ATP-binding protein MalK [Methanocella sp. PtaU1.Bin125]